MREAISFLGKKLPVDPKPRASHAILRGLQVAFFAIFRGFFQVFRLGSLFKRDALVYEVLSFCFFFFAKSRILVILAQNWVKLGQFWAKCGQFMSNLAKMNENLLSNCKFLGLLWV